jgi:endonuclease/exonuclease/phosphatase family metal-dependent hydrolase
MNFQGWQNHGSHSWSIREPLVVQALPMLKFDIIMASELHTQNMAAIKHALPYHRIIRGKSSTEEGQYTALIVDPREFKIVRVHSEWVGMRPWIQERSHEAQDIRTFTAARMIHRPTRTEFIAVSAHFDHVSEKSRVRNADQIISWVYRQRRRHPNVPVLVGGDFNCSWFKASPDTAYYSGGYTPFEDHGYTDAYRELHPDEAPNTMHRFMGEAFTVEDDEFGWWDPDRIWVQGLDIAGAEIVREYPDISDHYQVMARVKPVSH